MSTLQHIECDAQADLEDDPVKQVVIPRTADIGGFEVHRALPAKERRLIGPFIFWDQAGPGEFVSGKGLDVRPHPHICLSTVTYLFSGSLDHKDSAGSDIRITPGDVNLMTAGRGIVHSERTGPDVRQNPSDLFGIQSWLALPKAHEEQNPEFHHIGKADLPEMEYDGMRARVIMGSLWGKASPVPSLVDTLYLDIVLEAGAVFEVPVETEERGLYVMGNAIEISGVRYEPMQLLILNPGDQVVVKALGPLRMMVMGGEVMDGPRHVWWNFVASSKERIEQAKEDWKNGKFEKVAGDDEFIPLPD